jgi:hypothetical protein
LNYLDEQKKDLSSQSNSLTNNNNNNKNDSLTRTGQSCLTNDLKKIYKSKIASVPTPGYSGHTTVFQKPISYLNIDKILENPPPTEEFDHIMDSRMSESYRIGGLKQRLKDQDLPYVGGYKGFRTGVKAGNYHGSNFIDTSITARSNYLK